MPNSMACMEDKQLYFSWLYELSTVPDHVDMIVFSLKKSILIKTVYNV